MGWQLCRAEGLIRRDVGNRLSDYMLETPGDAFNWDDGEDDEED